MHKDRRELEAEPFRQAGRRDHIFILNKYLTVEDPLLRRRSVQVRYERCPRYLCFEFKKEIMYV